ncbi:Chromo domain protein cec-1, putative, partial [Perkinsus marinus ATCC 50983]
MTTRSRTAAKSKPRPDTMTQASTEEEEILQGLEVDVDDDDDDYEDDAVVAEVVEDVGDDVQETSPQQEESGGEKSPVQEEEEEMVCSPEIVMEDNLQSGGEAEEPVKVAEEETDKGLEASREGLVELEEEEQQEE